MNFAPFPQMADSDPLQAENKKLQTELNIKAGEVANLRQRLAGFEKDLDKLREEKHALMLQTSSARGAAAGAPSREASRAKEMEKEIAQIKSKLEFRVNENHTMSRRMTELEKTSAEKDRLVQEHQSHRNAMERELRHLQDQLRKQGQNFELERQQHEAKARALERREKTLVQEKEIEKAMVNESEVGHKRGREEGAEKERAPGTCRERSGEVEASGKGASLPKVNVKSEVDDRRSARTGSGKGNRAEADGREVRGDRRVDIHASGEEADVPSSGGARGASTARDWAVKIEHTDRSAVLTNTSAERLRVVKALLSGWGGESKRDGHVEVLAGFGVGVLAPGFGDSAGHELGVHRTIASGLSAGAMTAREKEGGTGSNLGLFLDGAVPVEVLLNDLQSAIADAVQVLPYNKSGRGLQREGMASLQQRAVSLLTKHLPALASLLSVSDACRKCVLEVAIREYHDAEGGAGEMENVFEGSSARGGPRRTGDVRRPTTGSGGARDAAGGAGARGSASAGVASLRPSMSAFQGSVGSGESVGRDKRSRPLMLLVVDLLIMSATDLQNVLKKLPREGTRWRGKDMRANGLVEASCVPEEAMVSHCLEILRLLLESCRIDQLELVAEILDLKRAQGWGDHCFGLIDHESVSPCIKLSCLSLLRVMVPCKEFRDAVCPPIHVDEVLDGPTAAVQPPFLLTALSSALQVGAALMMPQFTQEESPDSQIVRKVGHTALRILAQLCSVHESDWVQTLLRRTRSESFLKMGYSSLQVSAGEIIVYEVRRLSAAGARKATGAAERHRHAQPLLLRDAVSLLWMLVVASREGECARVQGFWKPGVWMPLLVALRRLENGSVCPGLDDLKKRSTAVAVHLAKDCMLDDSEGMGGEDTQWGTADGTLTMHEGSSIGLI